MKRGTLLCGTLHPHRSCVGKCFPLTLTRKCAYLPLIMSFLTSFRRNRSLTLNSPLFLSCLASISRPPLPLFSPPLFSFCFSFFSFIPPLFLSCLASISRPPLPLSSPLLSSLRFASFSVIPPLLWFLYPQELPEASSDGGQQKD